MVPLKIRIRLEYEKYLTSRNGLARSGMGLNRIAHHGIQIVSEYLSVRISDFKPLGLKFALCWADDCVKQFEHAGTTGDRSSEPLNEQLRRKAPYMVSWSIKSRRTAIQPGIAVVSNHREMVRFCPNEFNRYPAVLKSTIYMTGKLLTEIIVN
jgi:hypothetical protein